MNVRTKQLRMFAAAEGDASGRRVARGLRKTGQYPKTERSRRSMTFLAVPGVAALLATGVMQPAEAAGAAPVSGQVYQLSVGTSGQCLDVPGGATTDGVGLQQWGCSGNTAQQFRVVDVGGARYNVVNVRSGLCVDVPSWSTAVGTRLIQYRCGNFSPNQLWSFVPSGAGSYQLRSVFNDLCMTLQGASKASGAPIVQETCSDNSNKQWSFQTPAVPPPPVGKQMEKLDRGLVSARSGDGNFVSWRLLGTDPTGTAFNVYRGTTKVNAAPLTGATSMWDGGAAADAAYTVRAVVNGTEQPASPPSLRFGGNGFLDVPIQPPAGGTTPAGEAYTYSAGDASVGDVDGDGRYEIVLKWDPSNAKDNSQSGYTGNVFVDAYRLDGTRLWRIDLGRNIRAGAHYTQFQVYDYDGDGKAEVAMKTADGTRSGTGQVIGNAAADFRTPYGYILSGPELLTMFNGRTGAAMSTVPYDPPRGNVASWGDSYGNRVDRFLAATAYLDGSRPSLIMSRGYYTRAVVAAWDFRNGTLTKRWTFDSNTPGNGGFQAQGNHALSVADVDNDGRDEIIFGAAAIDDNGEALWNTGLGHGDAGHVGDLDPSRPGLEYFKVSEHKSSPSSFMADARTGQILWSTPGGFDNGRGVSADIWAGSPGAESWSGYDGNARDTRGAIVGRRPASMNFLAWWDGDPVRELLDRTQIDKYGPAGDTRVLTGAGVKSNNGTKATPALSGDLFGDWREEVMWPSSDSRALRIYTTNIPTGIRMPTLMHDAQYRVAVAWQNTGYNQPPHPSFFIGDSMATPPKPAIHVR